MNLIYLELPLALS